MADNYSELADKLKPYLASPNGSVQVIVTGGGGSMAVHDIGGEYHTGQLAQGQAPWAATKTELTTHAADPDAHHAKAHVLATNAGLGPDHSISGATAGWVLRATASNAARMAQLMVPDLGASGASWDIVALTAANTVGLRTPSSDVRSGAAEAYLKSNAAGELALKGLALGSAMVFAGNNTPAAGPHLQFASTGLIAAAGGLYINIDSDNTSSSNALIVQHDADTSAGEELLRLTESGWLSVLDRVRVGILDTASGSLRLEPADSIYLTPGASNSVFLADGRGLRTTIFESGFAGSGFRLDQGVTTAGKTTLTIDDLTVRGRMSVYELLIRQIRATNGAIFVSSTARAKRVDAITGGYRLYTTEAGETPTATTDHAHGFLAGDLLRAQRTRWNGTTLTTIYRSDLRVTTVDNLYTFRAVLESGDIPTPGMEFVRLGNTTDANRRGSLYLTADDDSAPFMDVVDGIASHSDWNSPGAIKVRIGKLTGITTVPNEYGIIAGSGGFADADQWIKASSEGVRLNRAELRMYNGAVNTGVWYANGQFDIGFDGVDVIADRDFTVHASRYLRIGRQTTNYPNLFYSQSGGYVALRSGTIDKIRFNDDGSSFFAGVMTIGTAGEIRQGTGALGTDYTGLRIWRDGSIGRIAGYNGNVVQWAADTDGRFKAANNLIWLDYNGFSLAVDTGYSMRSAVRWTTADRTVTAAEVYGVALPGPEAGRIRHRLYVTAHNTPVSGITRVDGEIYLTAEKLGGGYSSIDLAADYVRANGGNIWHAGNLISPVDRASFNGDFRSSGTVVFSNLAASAYQGILAQFVTNNSGNSYSGSTHTFYNGDGTAFQGVKASSFFTVGGGIYSDTAVAALTSGGGPQAVWANSLLAASNYATYSGRVPFNGAYVEGGIAIATPGAITSGYVLDANGAARFRSSIAVNAHVNLSPIAQPAASSTTGILYVGTDDKLYFLKKNGTTPILIAG